MQVSVWVPVLAALIAGLSGMAGAWFATRSQRDTTASQRQTKELELALAGMTALLNEYHEDRLYKDDIIREMRTALESCNQRLRAVEREFTA